MKIKLNKTDKVMVTAGMVSVFVGASLINFDYNIVGGSLMIIGANITGWVSGVISSANMYHDKNMFNEKFYSVFGNKRTK